MGSGFTSIPSYSILCSDIHICSNPCYLFCFFLNFVTPIWRSGGLYRFSSCGLQALLIGQRCFIFKLKVMAAKVGRLAGANGNSFLRRKNGEKKNLGGRSNVIVMASVAFPGMKEEYETLRLSPGAAEKDVKRAYRRLALQYHPDVCKGNNCGVQFHKINQAYENVMSSLEKAKQQSHPSDCYVEDLMTDYDDSWEEWMGWEGAGTLDYSSHINIYA